MTTHAAVASTAAAAAAAAAAANHVEAYAPAANRITPIIETEPAGPYSMHLIKTIQARMANKHTQQFNFPYIHGVTCYEKLMKIGQGTFGEVFKARCKKTSRLVALKKILLENEREGFPITAIREVKMLQRLRKTHITELIEICSTRSTNASEKATFYLVFTFCDFDLAGLLSRKDVKLERADIKTMMKHLFEGLHCIHAANILHRDMKAANILISHEGVLKLADFGLSRQMNKSGKQQNYTNRVVTLWYRPPELLLGSRRYGPAIDLWGAGCIMAELWTRSPILQGNTEQAQLDFIQALCGGITPRTWPGVEQLPHYKNLTLKPQMPRTVRKLLAKYENDEVSMELLESLLTLDPSKRPAAREALETQFFWSAPLPAANIKHIVQKLPSNIFEFTAGRGAHANRRPHQQMAGAGGAAQPNGVKRARYVGNNDNQMHDVIF